MNESQIIINNERRDFDAINRDNRKKSSQSLIAFQPMNRLNNFAIDFHLHYRQSKSIFIDLR